MVDIWAELLLVLWPGTRRLALIGRKDHIYRYIHGESPPLCEWKIIRSGHLVQFLRIASRSGMNQSRKLRGGWREKGWEKEQYKYGLAAVSLHRQSAERFLEQGPREN